MNLLLVAFSISLVFNGVLSCVLLLRRPRRQNSREASELLSDILKGGALVHVKRIVPTDVFLKSPREFT